MVDKSEITRANVSDNYLELLIYKNSDNENIIFDDSDTKVQEFMKDIPIIPHTKIYDTRFSYIYDFLNLVINKRIERNSLLSIEELYKLADEFINSKNNTGVNFFSGQIAKNMVYLFQNRKCFKMSNKKFDNIDNEFKNLVKKENLNINTIEDIM